MQEDGNQVTVTESGFVVSATHGFLGSSPDGLVNDPLESPPDGLIEVKHIAFQQGETLQDALIRRGICKLVEDHMSINRNHQDYYQGHQQIFCCCKTWTRHFRWINKKIFIGHVTSYQNMELELNDYLIWEEHQAVLQHAGDFTSFMH